MKAQLHSIHSSDIDDLDHWTPTSPDFAVPVRLTIGPNSGNGEESFDVTVCSLQWLAGRVAQDGPVDLRHHIVVASFHWPVIRAYLERRTAACSGASWNEIATQLSRFAYWEFEDYKP